MPQEISQAQFDMNSVFDAFVKIVAHTLVINNDKDKKFTNPDAMAEYVIANINKEKQQ